MVIYKCQIQIQGLWWFETSKTETETFQWFEVAGFYSPFRSKWSSRSHLSITSCSLPFDLPLASFLPLPSLPLPLPSFWSSREPESCYASATQTDAKSGLQLFRPGWGWINNDSLLWLIWLINCHQMSGDTVPSCFGMWMSQPMDAFTMRFNGNCLFKSSESTKVGETPCPQSSCHYPKLDFWISASALSNKLFLCQTIIVTTTTSGFPAAFRSHGTTLQPSWTQALMIFRFIPCLPMIFPMSVHNTLRLEWCADWNEIWVNICQHLFGLG